MVVGVFFGVRIGLRVRVGENQHHVGRHLDGLPGVSIAAISHYDADLYSRFGKKMGRQQKLSVATTGWLTQSYRGTWE